MICCAAVRKFPLLAAAAFALASCASSPPEPVEREQTTEATATVESVDYDKRLIELRTSDGQHTTVYAGPDVHNLDQVQPGDKVVVSYYQAIGIALTTPEKATKGVEQEVEQVRSPEGAPPSGAVGEKLTTTVEIQSVDPSTNTVTFKRSDGLTRSMVVEDPKAQQFVRKLKRGDLVQVTYREALAISVRPEH